MSLIHELVVHLRISPSDLLRIISTAPARYKHYTIARNFYWSRAKTVNVSDATQSTY
jgi:hypothetical protein